MANSSNNTDSSTVTMEILFEFWAKVAPCILQLVSHSKPVRDSADFQQNSNAKLSEMVNLHVLSLLKALKETHSTVLGKLLPLWSAVLSSQSQLLELCARLRGTANTSRRSTTQVATAIAI